MGTYTGQSSMSNQSLADFCQTRKITVTLCATEANGSTAPYHSIMQSKHATRSHYPAWRIGIVVGFATTVVMWLIAFFLHLQGLTAEPWLTGVALILAQTGGSVLAGRYASRDRAAWKLGLATGLTTSVLNLLILGSVLTEPVRVQADQAVRPDAGIMVAGYLSIGVVIGIVGAMLGSRFLASDEKTDFEDSSHDRWVSRFAWVAAFAVVPVLFTGGLTTSNQAGLAVPDWPNTYATNMFLYPVASMTGGKLYEHTHRLFGSLAGVAALGLFLYTLTAWIGAKRADSDRSRFYGVATLLSFGAGLAVLVQGVIGGFRVVLADGSTDQESWSNAVEAMPEISRSLALTTDNTTSLGLAVVHGITGQVTFAFLCVIACVLSVRWARTAAFAGKADGLLRLAAPAFLVTAVLQLSLGSVTRHFQHTHALYSHIGFSVIVTGLAFFVAGRAVLRHGDSRPLPLLGRGVLGVVFLQFCLGWVALMVVVPHYDEALGTTPLTAERPASSVLVATMHQMTGAALLALGAMLAVWTYRLVAPGSARSSEQARVPVPA